MFVGALVAAATAPACTSGLHSPDPMPPEDSVTVIITAPYPVRILDVFIYSDTLTMPLLYHIRTNRCELRAPRSFNRLTVAAVANAPEEFNLKALKRFDSAEIITMRYRDENPEYPLQSACGTFQEDTARLVLTSLLCPVRIVQIDNHTGEVLEFPNFGLSQINAFAEILRFDGFHTVETVETPDETAHPEMMLSPTCRDIGHTPAQPEITLYCYPFEKWDANATVLTLTAHIRGQRKKWTFPLPGARRGRTVEMHLATF